VDRYASNRASIFELAWWSVVDVEIVYAVFLGYIFDMELANFFLAQSGKDRR